MNGCPSCGHENQPGAKFCSECGAAFASVAVARHEERKVVTVLFADLVGFTSRSEQMDPEDVRALLSPFYARLRTELERFGGTVEKFIGDAVMAVFGAPVAHEDDPERAVRAALAIRDWVRDEGRIQVRVAVNTGEALVSLDARPSEGEGMAAGDVVNTAARLQSSAPVNGVLVGERTYRATRRAVDYRAAEPVSAKGKELPVPAWEALQVRAQLGVDVPDEARTPLVGRERELGVLRDVLARVRDEHAPQLVTLVGVPGIGKSRLLYELSRIVDAEPDLISWRQGRSLPYGDGISYWALAEMVKAQAGILDSDLPAQAQDKLTRMVSDLLADPADVEWAARHLGGLVGLGERGPAVSGDRRGEAFAAWRRVFEAMAEQRPLVLVFEDLHWADDGLLDFVDYLVEWAGEVPLLVVCTARPELLERRRGWGGGKPNAVTLSLAPMSDDDTARLIGALLGRAVLDADRQQELLLHAGGNPLYAEQYVQMVTELDVRPGTQLPETVQGLVGARLDLLTPAEKRLLQNAAVIGKVFWPGAVAALGGETDGDRVEEGLHRLVRKQYVRRERQSSVAAESQYAFLHVVVRDVAYGQIPRAARSDKHVAAARWIESLGRPDDHAEMLAHHYLNALDLARAAGRGVDELVVGASAALRAAGDRAYALNSFAVAAGFYRAALELWPETAGKPRAELVFRLALAVRDSGEDAEGALLEQAREALLAAGDLGSTAEADARLAEVWWFNGQRDRCFVHLERAYELIRDEPTSRQKAHVLSVMARYQMLAGEYSPEVAAQALELAQTLGVDELRAHGLITVGTARMHSNAVEGAEEIRRGLQIAVSGGYLSTAIRGYSNLAHSVEVTQGDQQEAFRLTLEARRVAERLGTNAALRWTAGNLLPFMLELGDWDAGAAAADEFLAQSQAQGRHYLDAAVRGARAWLRLVSGHVEAAVEDAAESLVSARLAKDPQALYPALAGAAYVLAAAGRGDAANEVFDELLSTGAARIDLLIVQTADCARAADLLGRQDEARRWLGDSHSSPWFATARALVDGRFLEAAERFDTISALRSAALARLRGAQELVGTGRAAEAEAPLREALRFFRAAGASALVREAERLLPASA